MWSDFKDYDADISRYSRTIGTCAQISLQGLHLFSICSHIQATFRFLIASWKSRGLPVCMWYFDKLCRDFLVLHWIFDNYILIVLSLTERKNKESPVCSIRHDSDSNQQHLVSSVSSFANQLRFDFATSSYITLFIINKLLHFPAEQ